MKKLLVIGILLISPFALAASGGHGDHGVPWGVITTQIINFAIVIALLTYLLRKKAADHFQGRAQSYEALLTRAESAKKEAEANKKQISERLSKLEQNAQNSIAQAKAEAEELKAKILQEAKELSKKLEEEAQRTVEFEIQRAKEQIRKDLLQEALNDAQKSMESGVETPDLKRLQSEFMQRVQVVAQ